MMPDGIEVYTSPVAVTREGTNLTWFSLAGLLFGVLLIIFEFSATILTIARSAQALRILGGWRLHDKGLYALLMEQGKRVMLF